MKKSLTKRKPILRYNAKSSDVPVLQGELRAVKGQISSLETSMSSKFDAVDKKILSLETSMNGKFDAVDKKISSLETSMNSKFDSLSAEMAANQQALLNEIQKIRVVSEEQNSRNIAVLDGYNSLNNRLEKNEAEIFTIKKHIGIT